MGHTCTKNIACCFNLKFKFNGVFRNLVLLNMATLGRSGQSEVAELKPYFLARSLPWSTVQYWYKYIKWADAECTKSNQDSVENWSLNEGGLGLKMPWVPEIVGRILCAVSAALRPEKWSFRWPSWSRAGSHSHHWLLVFPLSLFHQCFNFFFSSLLWAMLVCWGAFMCIVVKSSMLRILKH